MSWVSGLDDFEGYLLASKAGCSSLGVVRFTV